jgi:retinol dehydrogenase 12
LNAVPFHNFCSEIEVLHFQGAATTCYVGLNPQVKGVTGKYFADCNVEKTSRLAKSEELTEQLWDYSEKLLIKSAK